MAAASGAAPAGSNTNARSLRAPSPLTSEATIGVNGAPELSRPIPVSSRSGPNGYVTTPSNWWRRSKSLAVHSRRLGSPAVVAPPKPCRPKRDAEDWSRENASV